ncbi:MAG: HAMP domain-containing histidine kinase [Deltaproteobacteria bacterium]|nr:HAMP domain-containing histidine kinase [Deltaproteobacteria bacterium]
MTTDNKHPAQSPAPEACDERFFRDVNIEFLIHELKDPISIVETGARTLLKKQERFGTLTDRQTKTLNRIIRNATRARDMLYSLLEIGRAESGSFACSHFSPARTLLDVLVGCLELRSPGIADKLRDIGEGEEYRTYLSTCGIRYEAGSDATALKIYQDEIKFRQIVANLIKNALHYRNELLELRVGVDKDALVLEVTDDGPGIPDQFKETVFRRYTQLKECSLQARNGHGLGLAGARLVARSLGGDIELESAKDRGTSFRLRLPCHFRG